MSGSPDKHDVPRFPKLRSPAIRLVGRDRRLATPWPECLDILHAVEACRPLPGDDALSLDQLVVTVRMNMRFSKLVAALFDYGVLVRPLAQQVPAMPITLHEFALWEQARSLVLDTVGVCGTGLLPSEVAVEKIFSLLEGPLVVCAQQAAGNALCLGAGYLTSV